MGEKDRYFYFGAFYSFGLMLFLTLLFYLLAKQMQATHFSMRDDVIVTVSLMDLPSIKVPTQEIKPLEVPKKEMGKPSDAVADIFSDIEAPKPILTTTYKETHEPVVSDAFLKQIQTRKEIKEERTPVSTQKQIIETYEFEMDQLTPQSQSKSGEKNPYHAQVHDILYANWNSTQPNNRAIVKIKISSQGNFTYQVYQWSGNTVFDEELQRHLEFLMQKVFPLPPNGTVRLKVNFISEDKK